MLLNHDKVGKGFNVDPEQLAHDLAITKLIKDLSLTGSSNENEYYDKYVENLHDFRIIIEDKIRYDSTFD